MLLFLKLGGLMARRNIITNDDPVLHKKCREVVKFDEQLALLIDDMVETLHSVENAAGLAAPQVGILRCVTVIDVGEGVIELVNPQIIETKGKQFGPEGCLSYPNQYGNVERPAYVKVKAYDRFGKPFFVKGEGLLARALCHEIDHLSGIVFLEKAKDLNQVD